MTFDSATVNLLLSAAFSFVLLIAVIVAIGLILRRFVRRGRELLEMDARLTRVENSLQRGGKPDEREP